jgi:hypothetical protein
VRVFQRVYCDGRFARHFGAHAFADLGTRTHHHLRDDQDQYLGWVLDAELLLEALATPAASTMHWMWLWGKDAVEQALCRVAVLLVVVLLDVLDR